MAAASDPEEILRSTSGKENFQRITRLLVSGGTSLLREIFDSICPPSNLPTILSNPVTEKKVKAAKLTMPQWHCLCPSPGVYGESADFDVTLLVRLLRTICNLTPPSTGWDALPPSADHSLTADIARIKYYRNSVYGHVNQGMAIRDSEFKTLWQEISEALVRIAGQISSTRKTAWQGAIAKYLTDPLTTEDERNVHELEAWYKNDMEIKKSIDEVSERISRLEGAVHEGTDLMEATVRQEAKEIKDHLAEMNAKQSSRALVRLKIDCETISGPGLQQGATVMIGQSQESTGVIKEGAVASVTSSQSQVSNTTTSLSGNVGNGVIPSPQQILSLIASKYLNNLNPSTPEDFNSFIRYMKEVREVILVDCKPGSLIITVECGSLKILEELWQDYCTGNLGRVVQKFLVTEDILKELGLSEIKLITTIDEKDYKDCQKYFAGCRPLFNFDMSSEIESPVSKYGRSSEFGGVLDFIQSMISNDTLRKSFDIPHLVMVGRQNMAKTTLINRLIGRYLLPMRRNETANTLQARTTYPIILNLRNGPKTIVEVRCDTCEGIGGEVENPTDDQVEDFLKQVGGHLPKEEGTPISKTPVNVNLQGPKLTTLTLVDLPGAHFANDDPRMNQATQSLVLDYIEKNTKSIIVIVSEVGDPTGDSAINLVMRKAKDFRQRTICVLTKPDRLRETDDMGVKVALNKSSFTLEDGRFIVLRGKDGTDANEKDWDAEMTRVKEKEWFARHPQYKGILKLCGIDRLMDTMISLLAQKMITEIPVLVREMKERKAKVESELILFAHSEVPESSEGKGALVMKLKQNLITQLKTLLFNNTSDIGGGEQVRTLFNKFHDTVYKVDPLVKRNDDEIRKQQRKLEGVAAPLGDSSENSQLLQKLLYESYQGRSTVIVANSPGFPGPKSKTIDELIQSPVDQLIPISTSLVNNVENTLRRIVQDAINKSLSSFPTLKQAVEAKVVSKIFDTKREQTIQFIQQFLEMQKKSIDDVFAPVPFPDELNSWETTPAYNIKTHDSFPHPCNMSRTTSHLKYLAKKLYPTELMEEIEGRNSRGSYKELEDIKKVKKNVVRCFNLIKMNVCDTVPRCILHFFITQLVDDLEHALEQEDLVAFLKEKQDILERRKVCRAQFSALEKALPRTDEVLEKLLRMQDGSGPREK